MTPISLRQVPLFVSFNDALLTELSKILRPRQLPAGTVLCYENQPGDDFFIILDGQVEVTKTMGDGNEHTLTVRGPGDFLGEMSLFDRAGLRTASARAITRVDVVQMNHSDLDDLLCRDPLVAHELVRQLSLRLRDTDNTTICELQEKNRQLEHAYLELKAAQAQIIEKEKLEHELQVARRIQQSILPTELPTLPGFTFGARMEPARAVGGDFFDLIPLNDHHMGLAIGDISDKGVPAAIFMALCRSLLRAEARPEAAPAQVLRRVNQLLLTMNDAGMFVTVLYGILDGDTRDFVYARAGHEIPWVITAQGEIIQPPQGRGQPLGILDSPNLDEHTLHLPPGSTLLLYTDGLPDSGNETGIRLGHAALEKLAVASVRPSAQASCDALVEAIDHYRGRAAQNDDVTLMAVQTSKAASSGFAVKGAAF